MKYGLNSEKGAARGNLILILLGLVVVFGGLLFVLSRPSPEEQRLSSNPEGYRAVADQFVEAMTKKDAATAWGFATQNLRSILGDRDDWQGQLNQAFKNGDGDPEFVKSGTVSDPAKVYKNNAPHRVIYSFTINDNLWETEMIVIKEKTNWKVDELQSYQK